MTSSRLSRLFLVAVALPSTISLLNQWAFRWADYESWSTRTALVLFGLFVGQTALLSWAVGRLLDHWGWRLVIYVWALLLVNGQLPTAQAGMYSSNEQEMLAYAFLAAQFGALATWGVLGRWTWPLRVPATFLAATPLVLMLTGHERPVEGWVIMLSVQVCGLIGLLIALWLARYRMYNLAEIGEGESLSRIRQFSIAHMLVWTTAAALLLAVFRGLQPLVGNVHAATWLRLAILGLCCTMVALAAIWATLGQGSLWLRLTALASLPPAAGALLFLLLGSWRTALVRNEYLLSDMADLKWLWIAWTSLAAAFLAALLLLLRCTGYRLIRITSGI